MKRDLKLQAFYPQSPEKVWQALTDKDAMAEWLMIASDFEPIVGHKFSFRAKPQPGWDGTVACEITEIVPLKRIAYTWKSGGNSILTTLVTWTLEPEAGGTRLRLEHTGFHGMHGWVASFILQSGWRHMLKKKIPFVLARVTDTGFVPDPTDIASCH
jgi:uncharacterized protein YndB with AHSA1/START domain